MVLSSSSGERIPRSWESVFINIFRAMGLPVGSLAEKNDRSRFLAANDGFCTGRSTFPGVFRSVQPHGEVEDQRVGAGHASARPCLEEGANGAIRARRAAGKLDGEIFSDLFDLVFADDEGGNTELAGGRAG